MPTYDAFDTKPQEVGSRVAVAQYEILANNKIISEPYPENHHMETTYTPNAYSDPLTLPTVPPSVSLSPERPGLNTTLQRWLKALSGPALPVPNYTPEALNISVARWEAKWEYFQQTFREDMEQAEFSSMTRADLAEYVKRMETEFTRLRDRFVQMESKKMSADVMCGMQLVLSLIEDQIPQLLRLKAAEMNSISEPLQVLKQEVTHDDDPESGLSIRSNEHVDSHVPSSRGSILGNGAVQGTEFRDKTGLPSHDEFPRAPRALSRAEFMGATSGTATRAQAPAPPVTNAMSTAASHRANLLALSAISFFGAGMAWSTVFSDTRGDLVLTSWAASCFLVGAVSAVSATSLLDADGTLLERFMPVRWTVRLLSLSSLVHVFVGVMLVSAAILALDPNVDSPGAGTGGGEFPIRGGRVAGGYSLVICAVAVFMAFVIRGRYSRNTWFV